jgi:hypothetical protein
VQIEVTECLLSLGAETFSARLLSKNMKIKVYRTTGFLFCMGVKRGRNKTNDGPSPTVNALHKLLQL